MDSKSNNLRFRSWIFSLIGSHSKSRIFSTFLVILSLVSLVLSSPVTAQAAVTGKIYHPEDYIDNVSVSGNKKTVTYTFGDATAITDIYRDGNKGLSFTGEFKTFFYGDFDELLFSSYLLGVAGFPDSDAWSGVIDVSDIMPYADLKITGAYHVTLAYNDSPPGDVVCQWRWGFLCYDADMHYVKTDYTPFTSSTLPGGAGAFGYTLDVTTSYMIPSSVAYVMPVVQSIWTFGDNTYNSEGITIIVRPYPFSMSCDIDMIYEQSNTMQAVKDELQKLNDKQSQTNDKLDDINDKLDEIISGGEAGEQLGGAADDLTNAGDQMSGSLDSVDQFENDMMQSVQDGLDDIDVITGFGNFAASLGFVSGYLQKIFDGVEDWSIVIVLPLFLGIVFYICQYAGGATRVVHAANAKAEADHKAANDAAWLSQAQAEIAAKKESYHQERWF